MSNRWIAAVIICYCLVIPAEPAKAVQAIDPRIAQLDQIIERVQKAILRAQTFHAENKLKPGHPLRLAITPKVRLSFRAERFESDLAIAFDIHDKLVMERHKITAPPERVNRKSAPPVKEKHQPVAPASQLPPDDPIAAMRQAEKQTTAASPQPRVPEQANYDVYQDYRKAHTERMFQQDRAAETDMAAVLAQRKQAETERVQKRQRQAELQAQATKWQAELDKQASQSAQAAAQWEKEHSFGAYAARFLGVVVQTAVGSFTTALLSPVAVNLANKTVNAIFPSVNTTNLAAQAATTSAARVAVTNLGSAAGQAVSNSVTGSPAANTAAQGLQTPAY